MEHKLNFTVYSEDFSNDLGLVDSSTYFEKPSNLLYEVKLPSFDKYYLGYGNVNSLTVFTPINLNIGQATFPDGLYTVRMSVAPNKEVFICKTFIKSDNLKAKIANILDCAKECDTELVDKLYNIDKFLFAANIATDDKLKVEFFNIAAKQLKSLENAYYKV